MRITLTEAAAIAGGVCSLTNRPQSTSISKVRTRAIFADKYPPVNEKVHVTVFAFGAWVQGEWKRKQLNEKEKDLKRWWMYYQLSGKLQKAKEKF